MTNVNHKGVQYSMSYSTQTSRKTKFTFALKDGRKTQPMTAKELWLMEKGERYKALNSLTQHPQFSQLGDPNENRWEFVCNLINAMLVSTPSPELEEAERTLNTFLVFEGNQVWHSKPLNLDASTLSLDFWVKLRGYLEWPNVVELLHLLPKSYIRQYLREFVPKLWEAQRVAEVRVIADRDDYQDNLVDFLIEKYVSPDIIQNEKEGLYVA